LRDNDHRVDNREGRAGDHREPHPEDLADARALDNRGDTGDEQVGTDQ